MPNLGSCGVLFVANEAEKVAVWDVVQDYVQEVILDEVAVELDDVRVVQLLVEHDFLVEVVHELLGVGLVGQITLSKPVFTIFIA
jgi:hypothetical protein